MASREIVAVAHWKNNFGRQQAQVTSNLLRALNIKIGVLTPPGQALHYFNR